MLLIGMIATKKDIQEIRFNNKRLRTVDCCSQSFAFGQNPKSVQKCDTLQKVRFFGTKLNF